MKRQPSMLESAGMVSSPQDDAGPMIPLHIAQEAAKEAQAEIDRLRGMKDEEIDRLWSTLKGTELALARARDEIERLRGVIREAGDQYNWCTWNVLHEVCSNCRCEWKAERLDESGAHAG